MVPIIWTDIINSWNLINEIPSIFILTNFYRRHFGLFNNKMRKITMTGSIVLLLLISISHTAVIGNPSSEDSDNSTNVSSNNETQTTNASISISNSEYAQIILNITDMNGTSGIQVNASVNLLILGNFINKESILAAAVQKQYNNGTIEYDIYLIYVDDNLTIIQYEAIVRVISSSEYLLVNFSYYNFQATKSSGNSSSPNIISLNNQITAPAASSLSDVASQLTVGYTMLADSQIAADSQLNVIDGQFRTLFGFSQATLAYAAKKVVGNQASYSLFYNVGSGASFQFKEATALYDSDSKILYLFQLVQVVVPDSLIPK